MDSNISAHLKLLKLRAHTHQITQIIQITQIRLVMLHWTGGYLGPGGVREILPYPSTLVGSYPPSSSRPIQTHQA